MKQPITASALVGRVAYVREALQDGTLVLVDGGRAHVAASCLLQPQRGDRVVLTELSEHETFVHAVLERATAAQACLRVPGATRIAISAPELVLAATDSIEIQSVNDIEVAAVTGAVSICANHVRVAAIESIVQSAKHYLGSIGTFALQVGSLLRMHARQSLLTAEEDIKIDAERISVG